MPRLDPEVARLIGQLAGEGITVFVPQGAEHMLSVEDGKLVIHSELLEVTRRCGSWASRAGRPSTPPWGCCGHWASGWRARAT